jgi:hypothetical protein
VVAKPMPPYGTPNDFRVYIEVYVLRRQKEGAQRSQALAELGFYDNQK